MAWTQLTLSVDATVADKLSDLLESFLAQAVTTENAGEDEFYEVAFPGRPTWEKVRVTALFNAAVDIEPIREFALSTLNNWGQDEVPHQVSRLEDQDWERVWLDSFQPIEVGENLWVVPSWREPPHPQARNIRLDPGLAFGTGTHATTFMCLNWISRQNLNSARVLDYGSGSGILAIAALFSGAQYADAVDIDPLAVDACVENAKRNNISSEQMRACLPNQLQAAPASYDLVIANILADVILELKDELIDHVTKEGQILLTGILDSQADKIIDAFDGFDFVVEHKEQWVLLVGDRTG